MYKLMFALALACALPAGAQTAPASPSHTAHAAALAHAAEPLAFVNARFDTHDLLIFDDALHTALEPWNFINALVRTPDFHRRVKFVFLEVAPVNHQPAIDAYLDSPSDDPRLLAPLFQNATDYGWNYQTYLDLLRTVREVNRGLPPAERLRVIATDQPSYWPLIHTRRQWELTMLSGEARDYHLYKVIASTLDNFRNGKKGIFLTNTRHAYKGIRNGRGELYWNAGTFFHQHHPGKTYALHFHHVALQISRRNAQARAATREGLDNAQYRWVRMADGAWDCAHEAAGYKPLALDIRGTPFGAAPYIGNHMLDAQPGQTMADAFDAVIFLGPIESFKQTARMDIFDAAFKAELVRRLRIMTPEEELPALLSGAGVKSLEAYVEATFQPRDARPDPLVATLPPRVCTR